MKKIAAALPDWLEGYHTEYPKINELINTPYTVENSLWITLALTCPPVFEAYAIIFHPFWIHQRGKELAKKGELLYVDLLKEEEFERVSWKNFFKQFNREFRLESACQVMEDLSNEFMKLPGGQPDYYMFPGEGECEAAELEVVLKAISKLHPACQVNYHYNIMRTIGVQDDLQYQGSLADFNRLPRNTEVWGNPSSIYPDDKSWYISSNYDSCFTCIGGSHRLVNNITQNKVFEIFELEYLIKPTKFL